MFEVNAQTHDECMADCDHMTELQAMRLILSLSSGARLSSLEVSLVDGGIVEVEHPCLVCRGPLTACWHRPLGAHAWLS